MLLDRIASGIVSISFALVVPSMSWAANGSEPPSEHNWRCSKMVGLAVYDDQKEKVGSIDDLLMDPKGRIMEVVISVGGILGTNDKLVTVPLVKMDFSQQPIAEDPGNTSTDVLSKLPPTKTTGTISTPVPISNPDPWLPDHAVFDGRSQELKNMPEFTYAEDR